MTASALQLVGRSSELVEVEEVVEEVVVEEGEVLLDEGQVLGEELVA